MGFPLESRMIHMVLDSLIHSFDWAPPKGMSAELMDMTEKIGITMVKAMSLEAIPMPRLSPDVY
jgi:hypothetical protein